MVTKVRPNCSDFSLAQAAGASSELLEHVRAKLEEPGPWGAKTVGRLYFLFFGVVGVMALLTYGYAVGAISEVVDRNDVHQQVPLLISHIILVGKA